MMTRSLNILTIILFSLLMLALLAGLTWANVEYAQHHPVEKEFLVPWLASRTFLQYGNNPYDDPTTQRAQIVYYGRLAAGNEDPLRLDVPFPLEIFYLPFALITNYPLAFGFWMTLLEVALVGLGFLSLQLTAWKPPRVLKVMVVIYSALWVYAYLPLVSGHALIFVSLALTGLLLALRDGRDELAGALLVLPLFKPEITGLFTVFILWWSIDQRRWRILGGFLMTMAIFVATGFFLLPGWFMPFIRAALSHIQHNPGLTPGIILGSWWPAVGPRLGWAISALLLLMLFLEWRSVRKKEFRHVLFTACLTLAASPFLGIPILPQEEVVLFLPLMLLLAIFSERWSHPGQWGIAGFALPVLFLGFWAMTLGLSFKGSLPVLNEVLVLSLPSLLIIGLYWMRWWAIRPPRTWSETPL